MRVVPYLATLDWYRASYGKGETPRAVRPNRAFIGEARVGLTIPIEGGASAVKRIAPEDWMISEHGRWRHVHWGAIFSVYGKAPYFAHYAGRLRMTIEDESLTRFADLTAAIDTMLREAADLNKLTALEAVNNETVRRVADEMQRRADGSLPLLHYVMNMGPDTLFLLI